MPHPAAGGLQPGATAAPSPADCYRLRALTRITLSGIRLRAGGEFLVPTNRLRVAAWLVRTGCARPLDEATRRDIELFERLQAVLSR